MGIWDRFGRGDAVQGRTDTTPESSDKQAIARYRYLLRTAPPETIEQAHAEAFAALTPEQRRMVLKRLSDEIPERERETVLPATADNPGALARLATRAEVRRPGALERAFGGSGAMGGPSLGSMIGGSLLGSLAGTVLGSMIAQHFFSSHPEANRLFGDTSHDADDSTRAHAGSDDNLASDTGAADDIAGDFSSSDTFDV